MATQVFGTIVANGTTASVTVPARSYNSEGVFLLVTGDFAGATVTAHILGLDGTPKPLGNLVFTDDFNEIVMVPNGREVSLVTTGATGTPDIDFELDCMSSE